MFHSLFDTEGWSEAFFPLDIVLKYKSHSIDVWRGSIYYEPIDLYRYITV